MEPDEFNDEIDDIKDIIAKNLTGPRKGEVLARLTALDVWTVINGE